VENGGERSLGCIVSSVGHCGGKETGLDGVVLVVDLAVGDTWLVEGLEVADNWVHCRKLEP
jgi:hypothetical protein